MQLSKDEKDRQGLATDHSTFEADLIARAQEGDRGAFAELVRRHYAGVTGVVYRLCGDAHLAEDAAQEAFIQAWLHLPEYRPRAPLRNWLYRMAVNAALDALRKEKQVSPMDLEDLPLADPQPDPEDRSLGEERARLVQEAVNSLPTASRAVLVLREYERLSYQEIGEALDIPVGTVMSRLNYARGLLREKLEEQLYPLEVEHV